MVATATFDRVHPHPPDVEEKIFTELAGYIKDGPISCNRILDGLPKVPLLRSDWKGEIVAWQLAAEVERNI